MLAVWLRAAASACKLARCCPAAGPAGPPQAALAAWDGLATGLGSSGGSGAGETACAGAPGAIFFMPTVVQEPLSGVPPSMISISDDTDKASAGHLSHDEQLCTFQGYMIPCL